MKNFQLNLHKTFPCSCSEVLQYLETAPLDKPAKLLWDLAEIAETGMGGTSGGIYSLGLAAASQSFARYLPINV